MTLNWEKESEPMCELGSHQLRQQLKLTQIINGICWRASTEKPRAKQVSFSSVMSPKVLFISFSPICLLWLCFISRLAYLGVTRWLPINPGLHASLFPSVDSGVTERTKKFHSHKSPAMFSWSSLAWTNLCGQGEGIMLIPLPYIIYLTSRVDPNGQPRPRAYRKGKEKWCWECNPQRSAAALADSDKCLPPLLNYSSQTSQKQCTKWHKEKAVREWGEREQSSSCRHSLSEFSKSSLANPKCLWVES